MVILGSNVNYLLEDRLDTAVNFATNYAFNTTDSDVFVPTYNSIHWVFSGGIKNPDIDTETEADKMAGYVLYREPETANWEYFVDQVSTNTAENFVMLNRHINRSRIKYSNVYIVTSGFHYNRAKKFADTILPNNNFNWILGTKEETDSEYWERIHMQNIEADINKLFKKFKIVF